MDYPKHEALFSQIRMLKYYRCVNADTNKAVNIYRSNILLSQSIYPLISILEVGLRNAIDRVLRNHFKSNNWILEQKKGFMIDPALTYKDRATGKYISDTTFTDKIYRVEGKFKFEKTPTLHNRIVAELSLGFWTKFFDTAPIKVLKGVQLNAFNNSPGIPAKDIYSTLNDIRALRNRISHHEPVCFDRNGNFCIKSFHKKYLQTKEAIRWIDSDLANWSEGLDNVNHHLKAIIQ